MWVTAFSTPNKSSQSSRRLILGVAGGSGSGKTFFAQKIFRQFGASVCSIVYQDHFYIDQSSKFDFDGGSVNFDHPSSLDFPALANSLKKLKIEASAEIPIYDFSTHKRLGHTAKHVATPIILVDGILILNSPEVRAQLDAAVFFDTPENLRFQRRLERDVKERGRTPEGVRAQFENQVKPMHDQFVEPSKQYARWVVDESSAREKETEIFQYLTNFLA